MRAILLVIPAATLSAAAVSLVARLVIPQTCDMGKPAKPVERLGRRAASAMITPVVCWISKIGNDGMTAEELKSWRKGERGRLIAAREGLDAATLERFRQRLDSHIWRSFPGLATSRLAFYWPIRGEYDARPLTQKLREHGAVTALPVVVGARQPLVFRQWHPGVALASGPLGISYPVGSDAVVPTAMLVPMLGWDEGGYRLGYGAGFFDRTLASLTPKPVAIGVSYELGKLKTIHPQSWDIPMDWVVTECGVYRRDPEGLVLLGEPVAGEPSALASPVCYSAEVDPDP